MTDEMKFEIAKKACETLCSTLDAKKCHYTREDKDLVVHFNVSGDDLPIRIIVIFDTGRQLVRLVSPMPFQFGEDKLLDGAVVSCAASYALADGSFDYDISDGTLSFRMTALLSDDPVGEGLFEYMISCACVMVDDYNDKFFAVSKGVMSIEEFIANEEK